MKETLNAKSSELIYYALSFFYISTDLLLSLVALSISKLGQGRQVAKVIILFLAILVLFNIFFSKLTLYFLIPLIFSSVLFIFSDKKAHFTQNKFSYFADDSWQNILRFGKNWFKYGLIASIVGLVLAIIQVQVFQGGEGGFFQNYDTCIQYSADGASCLLTGSSTKLIGDRLFLVILIYAGQAFIWAGLILALLNDRGRVLANLGSGNLGEKNKWVQKINDFRKTHYI